MDAELIDAAQGYLMAIKETRDPDAELTDAWMRFYTESNSLIRRALLRQGVERSHLDDCIQEAWLQLTLALPELHYDPARGCFEGWLCTIARRAARDYLRRYRRPAEPLSPAVAEELVCHRTMEPQTGCERAELRASIRQALAAFRRTLSPTNDFILYSCAIRQQSVSEVARDLTVPPEIVSARYYRIRRAFRRFLQAHLSDAHFGNGVPDSCRPSETSETRGERPGKNSR